MRLDLDPDTCYRALRSRDRRFDGRFFVGVRTTGIYCRPVCPARLPRRDRCRFFGSAAEAESQGFRPCLRCRPERAPGRSRVDACRSLAERAEARIRAGALNGRDVPTLARELHVGPRQLRRTLTREFGLPPVALAQTYRLLLAKRLLAETDLPVGRIAHASGFSSLRRFNALTLERWGLSPSRLRRSARATRPERSGSSGGWGPPVSLTLEYRPPYDWVSHLDFLSARALPGVEAVQGLGRDARYLRTLEVKGHRGWIEVRPAPGDEPGVRVQASLSLLPVLMEVLDRVRTLFDLDAEPGDVAGHLGRDPLLEPFVCARAGLRIPGSADAFELAWRAVLGQQVSVSSARTLAARVVEAFADSVPEGPDLPPLLTHWPVRPETLAEASVDDLAGIGIPGRRAACLKELAARIASGTVEITPAADPEATLIRLRRIPGIGPWTAGYMALRALHRPDGWPSGDGALRRALGDPSPVQMERMAEAWRPWRGYAALHLWRSLSDGDDP